MTKINDDFLQGSWQGFFIAKAPYGVFQDKVIINFKYDEFDITYFNEGRVRSAAKGNFILVDEQLQLNSVAERFGSASWNYIKSSFVFRFLEKTPTKIKLNAKDHLGVEKTLNLEKN